MRLNTGCSRALIRITAIVTFATAVALSAAEVEFDDLLSNPVRYNRQRVTVKGFATTGGDDFYLWRDPHARQHVDLKHVISVLWDLREKPNGPANLRWVRVTGIVDTSYHGRFGDEKFGLIKKRVDVLPGPRQRQFLYTLGVFRNDSSIGTHVLLSVAGAKPGGIYCDMQVGPRGISDCELREGKAEITTLSGRPLVSCEIRFSGSARQFYDPDRHAYYFRYDEHQIKMVPPSQTASWNLSFPERD